MKNIILLILSLSILFTISGCSQITKQILQTIPSPIITISGPTFSQVEIGYYSFGSDFYDRYTDTYTIVSNSDCKVLLQVGTGEYTYSQIASLSGSIVSTFNITYSCKQGEEVVKEKVIGYTILKEVK